MHLLTTAPIKHLLLQIIIMDKSDGRVEVSEASNNYTDVSDKLNLTLYDEGLYDNTAFTFTKCKDPYALCLRFTCMFYVCFFNLCAQVE